MLMCANLKDSTSHAGVLRGTISNSQITIAEHGLKFNVNISEGHKTGFYLDQRANRQRVRVLAKDKDILDCFCYTGGFTVYALAGGAKSVVSVDLSADALRLGRENISLNGLPESGVDRSGYFPTSEKIS